MTATPPPKPRAQRSTLWLSLVAALLLAVCVLSAGYVLGAAQTSESAGSAHEQNESSDRPTPPSDGVPIIVELPEPVAETSSLIPSSCEGIYSTDWATRMDGLVLNAEWTQTLPANVNPASADEVLSAALEEAAASEHARALLCRWVHENGGGDRGLTTSVVALTEAQQAEVLAQMTDAGFDCFEELNGTRCVSESASSHGESFGESHFVREGVWVATRWLNISPDGYTHDIINTIWP